LLSRRQIALYNSRPVLETSNVASFIACLYIKSFSPSSTFAVTLNLVAWCEILWLTDDVLDEDVLDDDVLFA
jgi:hypothetical protein